MADLLSRWHAALAEQSPVAIATVIQGPEGYLGGKILVSPEDHTGTAGNAELDKAVVEGARAMLEGGKTGTVHYGPRGQRRMEDVAVFIQSFAPPPRMYVFGAIDFASAVARVGKFMGYRVIVCDARAVFATRERFPSADEIVVAWPDEFLKTAEVDGRSVIAVLTHDPKFDVPVLKEPQDARQQDGPPQGGGRNGRATRARQQPHRPGHRGAHPRGDGDSDRGRDRRAEDRAFWRAPRRKIRPHPRGCARHQDQGRSKIVS
jgi:xanthine dehydrogenase accessory factor